MHSSTGDHMCASRHVYGEGKEPMPAVNEPTLIFMINKSLQGDTWSDQQVYEATRRSWVVGDDARERAVYALGVKHGVVRGAYRIERWHHDGSNRWHFDGVSATELDVVGRSAARLKPRQGDMTPVRRYLNGISAPTTE